MTVRIRPAVNDDVPALAALAALTFPLACPPSTPADEIEAFVAETFTAERFAGHLADAGREVLVAEQDGEVVGYAMLVLAEPDDPEVVAAITTTPTVDLDKFYVHPDRHGSGVAAALMDAAAERARAAGGRAMWLGVNQENERANRFYAKHGFAVVGTKHFRIGARVEDDFVRERVL